MTTAKVAAKASALSAKSLLDKLIAEAPFVISGIQVDGGAEFKSVFEAECQARGLELFVLPPKRPDLNGCVERAQSTWRYEFYAAYDLPHRIDRLQAFVDAFAHRFNHHRPHDALGGKTPAEYLQALSQGDPPPSHKS
ncbi:MAG TPA: integrase core domain-containing protein [Methylocella sp.]|nr:integrase core domain-containing protein [Methylocella sp.]